MMRYYTIEDIAYMLEKTEIEIEKMIQDGRLKYDYKNIDGNKLVSEYNLERYLELKRRYTGKY
ncbi:MAG: hypothetical protein KBS54_00590 [Synergistaceae bacterium]|nr:hypothetical protein [Candidatus Equadaptatus faecalis]